MKMKMTFSNGVEWEVKEVPPFAINRVQAQVPDPERPEIPLVERQTGLGGTERLPAGEDSPEYQAYLAALGRWSRELAAAEERRGHLVHEFSLLYAFEGLAVPEDWEPPRLALAHAGLSAREGEAGRLLDYVEFALLVTEEDVKQASRAMHGESAPLTEVEVAAAEKFRPGEAG